MGPLILWAWAAALAADPKLLVVAPQGDPAPGEEIPLWVAVSDQGRAVTGQAPELTVSAGELLGPGDETSPGLWQFPYRAPAEPQVAQLRASLGASTATAALAPGPARPPSIQAPATALGSTGQPVSFSVQGRADLAPEDLQVSSAEGRVTEITRARDGLRVTWSPGEDPFPRAVPLGLRDRAHPEEPPQWVEVQLRGRARVPIQTEPGSKVTLKLGGRSYGPFEAGADGVANAGLEVRPGEDTAEVIVQDRAGNTTRSTLALGGAPTPSIALLSAAHVSQRLNPPIHVKALDPEGRPWRGAAPRCTSTLGPPALQPAGQGLWTLRLPVLTEAAFFDVRVECSLEDRARAAVILPVERALPSRIVLRTWPEELSADSPVAQVLVTLENRLGERVPGEGLEVAAARGRLQVEPDMEAGALRASYDGADALSAGEDLLSAWWRLPAGSGPVADIELSAQPVPAEGGAVPVAGRALDAAGLPLPGVQLTLVGGGTTVEVSTDRDGWGRAALVAAPGEPLLIEARGGGRVRRAVVFADHGVGRTSTRADLTVERSLSIREGRVREVFLSADPAEVPSGAGAKVRVRLLDRGGNPITDIPPHLSASQGAISAPTVQADGTYLATWAPPPSFLFGEVQISAVGAEGTPGEFRGSTTLTVVPHAVSRAPGMNAGLVVSATGQPAPWFDLEFDQRLPWTTLPLYGRLAVGTYGLSATGVDDVTGASLDMQLRLFPVSLGVVARGEGRRRASWVGMAALAAPYQLEVQLDADTLVQGPGLTPPGLAGIAGASLRVRTGEVQLQAQYLGLTMGDTELGWRGGVGGLVATLGYKLIY